MFDNNCPMTSDRVVEVVERTLQGQAVKLLGKKSLPKLDLPKIRKNPLVEIIPLSTGRKFHHGNIYVIFDVSPPDV